ncbi:hypothetical protein EME01_52450 [Sinorhizobium meliloti]|nr:hypothetical protein EME01_52450 [Sinorhizobium meliloti]
MYVIGLISRTRFECRSDLTLRRGGYIDHGQYCRDGLSSWGDLQQAAGWLFTPAWAMEEYVWCKYSQDAGHCSGKQSFGG